MWAGINKYHSPVRTGVRGWPDNITKITQIKCTDGTVCTTHTVPTDTAPCGAEPQPRCREHGLRDWQARAPPVNVGGHAERKTKKGQEKKTASRLEVGEHAARAFGSVEEQTTAVFSSANAQFIPFFFFLFCCIRFCELTRGINARLQLMRRSSVVETFVDYF